MINDNGAQSRKTSWLPSRWLLRDFSPRPYEMETFRLLRRLANAGNRGGRRKQNLRRCAEAMFAHFSLPSSRSLHGRRSENNEWNLSVQFLKFSSKNSLAKHRSERASEKWGKKHFSLRFRAKSDEKCCVVRSAGIFSASLHENFLIHSSALCASTSLSSSSFINPNSSRCIMINWNI